MLWGHSYKSETPLVIDIVQDIRKINDMSIYAKKAGMVILGGGVCKHQIANSMLFVRILHFAYKVDTISDIVLTEKWGRLCRLRQYRTRVRWVR